VISDLDRILRDLLLAEVAGVTNPTQVRFQPPDAVWRSYVSGLSVGGQPANALNVFLVELRENRRLRSGENTREVLPGGTVAITRSPERLDCHYLISAWSPATVTPPVEPALDEHALLYDVVTALENSAPLNPSRIYAPMSAPWLAVPEPIREADLPTSVASEESFVKLPEFWGTMGADHRWKPVVHLTVTLPILRVQRVAGPMVTTTLSEYRQGHSAAGAELLVNLGGHVLDTADDPVPGAWVHLRTDPAGALVHATASNGFGRFVFTGLQAGTYRLRAGAQGAGSDDRTIEVPSNTGEYDLHLA
jgi:hypothetical protein